MASVARAELLNALEARDIPSIQAAMSGYADAVQGVQLQTAAFELLSRVNMAKEVELDTLIVEMRKLATRRRASIAATVEFDEAEEETHVRDEATDHIQPKEADTEFDGAVPVPVCSVAECGVAECGVERLRQPGSPAGAPTDTTASLAETATFAASETPADPTEPASAKAAAVLPVLQRLMPAASKPTQGCMSPGSKWLRSQENQGAQRPTQVDAGSKKSFLIGQLQRSSVAGQMRVSLPRGPLSPVGAPSAQAQSPGSQWLNEQAATQRRRG